jgi:ABC-type uncharacterized transport system involved in gliding motility auxiliary subunit
MSDNVKNIRKSLFSAGGLVLILFIVLLVNLIFSGVVVRWDATENNLYSLSDGTKNILNNLEQDVVIKLFYSANVVEVPNQIKTFAKRANDFISEYEYHSFGRVSIERYNPVIDSEEEEWAQKYGIKGLDLPGGDRFYFGLVAMAADQEEAIAFINPSSEGHLEYDLTRIISRVQNPKKLSIGIFSSLPIFGTPMGMPGAPQQMPTWFFIEELRKNYSVTQIQPNADTIDEDLDLLILLHPKNLSQAFQYAVDQYLLQGGNLLVYADPLSVMDNPRGGPPASIPENLFKSLGISMDASKVVMDYNYVTNLRNRNNQSEANPLWLSARPEGFNQEDIVTSQLESVLLPLAGSIVKDKESSYDFQPLIQSSTNAALVESFKNNFGVEALRKDFKPANERYNLAVRIKGKFKTAFPDGKPEKEPSDQDKDQPSPTETDTDDKAKKDLKEGIESAMAIVIADSDNLFDGYYVSKQNFLGFNISNVFNDNLNLLLNCAEMLTGSQALIEIRSRGVFERPFIKVQELERKAQDKWLAREQELVRKVDETNNKLRQIEQQKDASQRMIISAEQEAEIKKFQEEKRRINKELKIVRRNLRSEIESLGRTVKFTNIFLMAFLVSISGIIYAVYKRRKIATWGK